MAGVLPLLPQRHRAAPKPALLWILGLAAVASLRDHRRSWHRSTRSSTSRLSAYCWSGWVTLPFIFAGIVAWRQATRQRLRAIDDLGGLHHSALHPAVDEPAVAQHRRAAVRPAGRGRLAAPCSSPTPQVDSPGEPSES